MDGIVLKDRNGNNIEYPGVNHIKVKTTDGATKDFIARTPVETTVDLDFSGGAMEVNPESEELFSKVNIPVPENLNPENIAEGVNIAGIVGTRKSGKAESVLAKDINFFDYDGTVVYAYSLSDLPLSELPALPDHSGDDIPLTAQGWNYTLDEVNAATYTTNIGAIYIPTDGATKIGIHIPDTLRRTFSLYITQTVTNGVYIDWGDGNTATLSGTGSVNTSHTYTEPGSYVISLLPADGCEMTLGQGTINTGICGDTQTQALWDVLSFIMAVHIGRNCNIVKYALSYIMDSFVVTIPDGVVSLEGSAFFQSAGFEHINIPKSVTTIGNSCFYSCTRMVGISIPQGVTNLPNAFQLAYYFKHFAIPKGVASIADKCIYYCRHLPNVTVPEGVTSIGTNFMQDALGLHRVDLPSTLVSIGETSFRHLYNLKELHIKAITPPTLSASSIFEGLASDCVIYVPSASLSKYKTATYWSTHASKMVGV